MMTCALIGLFTFLLPISVALRPFTMKRLALLLSGTPLAACLLLLAMWGLHMLTMGAPTLLVLLLVSLLAIIIIEDFDTQLISIAWLVGAVAILMAEHGLNAGTELDDLIADYCLSGSLAVFIFVLGRIVAHFKGRPAIGAADIPLIFALGLKMSPSSLLLWILLFCFAGLIGAIGTHFKQVFNRKSQSNGIGGAIPFAPYLISSAALVRMIN